VDSIGINPTKQIKSHCEEWSDEAILSKNEIAAPFGLAMTVMIILSFV